MSAHKTAEVVNFPAQYRLSPSELFAAMLERWIFFGDRPDTRGIETGHFAEGARGLFEACEAEARAGRQPTPLSLIQNQGVSPGQLSDCANGFAHYAFRADELADELRRVQARPKAAQLLEDLIPAVLAGDDVADRLDCVVELCQVGRDEADTFTHTYTVDDLLDARADDLPQLLPGWGLQDIHLLAAQPGIGKTHFAISIGLCAASGLPLLAHFHHSKPLNVVFVQEEMPAHLFGDYVAKALDGLGLNAESVEGRFVCTPPMAGFNFSNATDRARLTRFLDERVSTGFAPDLLIMDSVHQVQDVTKPSDGADVRRFFRERLQPLRERYRCGILPLHHTSKGVFSRERKVEDEALIADSIQYLAASDSATLMLSAKDPRQRILKTVKSRTANSKPRPMRFEFHNPHGPGGGHYLRFVEAISDDVAQAESRPRSKGNRALDLLEQRPGRENARTKAELSRLADCNERTVRRALETDPRVKTVPGVGPRGAHLFYIEDNDE